MQSRLILFCSLACSCFTLAHPHPDGDPDTPHQHDSPRDAATQNLLAEHKSYESLQKAIDLARNTGVTEQAILEAKFIYFVDHNEENQIADLAPELSKLRDSFNPNQSLAFASKDDLLAVTEYSLALVAKRKGNLTEFKKHITEAFWLSPQQGVVYAPLIEAVRLKDAMARVEINLSTPLATAKSPDTTTTLKQILGDKKAILLHFWSPSSAECEASLSDFNTTRKELEKHQIAATTVIHPNETATLAEVTQDTTGFLVDSNTQSIASSLLIRNLPSFVLLTPKGTVLFNGSPSDPEFWSSLKKISPDIQRPNSSSALSIPTEK